MSNKTKLIILVVVAVVGYACGRYLQPAKVITQVETKIEIVEVEVEKTKTEIRTIIKEVVRPDGTTEKETTTENINESEKKNTKEASTEKKKIKIVENDKIQWKAQVLVGLETIQTPTYRVGIERRVLGPIFAGAYSNTSIKDYGVSVSMEF